MEKEWEDKIELDGGEYKWMVVVAMWDNEYE